MAEATKTLSQSLSGSTSITPIRRRPSRGSLSAALLSASRSHSADGAPPLTHLSALFSEIADDIQDLTANFERLDALNDSLDTFNEAFASLLYGMKMNAFCEEFVEAPTAASFEYAAKRAATAEAAAAAQAALSRSPSPTPSMSASEHGVDTTFQSSVGDRIGAGRGGSIPRARGRGTGMATRGRAMAAKKKERRLAFASELITTLPIKYREEQPHRGEMEAVISALRDRPEGLYIQDIVKTSNVPSHRVNEACLALKRAKHAITQNRNGLLYQLDPSKYPPE